MTANINDDISLSDIGNAIKKLFSDRRANVKNILPALLAGFAIMFLHVGFSAPEMKIGLANDPWYVFRTSWINEAYVELRLTLYCLAAYVFYLFYDVWVTKKLDRITEIYCRVFAFASAFVVYLAKSYYEINSWKLVFTTHAPHILLLALMLLALTPFNYRVEKTFLWILARPQLHVKDFPACGYKRFLLKSFAVFAAIEALYLAAFYPGIGMFDGIHQLLQYYGGLPLTNHHPVAATYLMGTIFSVGKYLLGSDDGGLFFYCVVQSLFQSLVFTCCLATIARLTQNRLFTNLSLCFFAVTPSLMNFGVTLMKDTLYYNFCLLALTLLSKILLDREEPTKKIFAGFTASCVCIFLTRNNGIFVVMPMLLAALAARRKNKKALRACCAVVAAAFCVLVFALSFSGIHQPRGEALSIPFQQTARLFKVGAAIDAEDREAMSKIFGGFDFAKWYDPKEADPIKSNFIETDENLQRYKNFYIKYLCRYPQIYLEAFFNQNCGWFFPSALQMAIGHYGTDARLFETHKEIKISASSEQGALVEFLKNYGFFFYYSPVNNALVNSSFYVWLFLFCAGIFFALRSSEALAFVMLPLFTVAVCLFSPVTAYIRYVMPLVAATPLLLMWCVKILPRRAKPGNE